MSGGDIAGLIAAGAFLLLVILLAVPIFKFGRVLDEIRRGVGDSVDSITPTLVETQETMRETNRQLAKVDAITEQVHETTSNVNSLVALTAATVGGPLIKLAGFSAAAAAGFRALKPQRKSRKN